MNRNDLEQKLILEQAIKNYIDAAEKFRVWIAEEHNLSDFDSLFISTILVNHLPELIKDNPEIHEVVNRNCRYIKEEFNVKIRVNNDT